MDTYRSPLSVDAYARTQQTLVGAHRISEEEAERRIDYYQRLDDQIKQVQSRPPKPSQHHCFTGCPGQTANIGSSDFNPENPR